MDRLRTIIKQTPSWVRIVSVLIYISIVFGLSSLKAEDLPTSDFYFVGLDKLVHICVYSGFGFLLTWLMTTWSQRMGVLIAMVILFAMILGSTDELYQSTVPGRHMSVFDLVADLIGATIGGLMFTLFMKREE